MHMSRRLAVLLAAASSAPLVVASPYASPAADSTTSSSSTLATAPWVGVGTDGSAYTTVTPVATTVSGVATVINPQPTTTALFHDETTTTTTAAAQATATSGAGAFAECFNTDGDLAPFCAPAAGSTLNPGNTYYITWDPSFFDANMTVALSGVRVDSAGNVVSEAFSSSSSVAASKAFYLWTVDSSLLEGVDRHGINVSISMVSYAYETSLNATTNATTTATTTATLTGPTVTVATATAYVPPTAKAPKGPALYIGLPIIAAFVVLMVVGTCWWNQRARRLGLEGISVMGRGRRGFQKLRGGGSGYAVRKSRRQRVGAVHLADDDDDNEFVSIDARKTGGIQLQNREVTAHTDDDDDHHHHHSPYSDSPRAPRVQPLDFGLDLPPGRPRRDSDALGSLAGTPTEDHFGSQTTPATTGNAFRDELRRQEQQKKQQENLL